MRDRTGQVWLSVPDDIVFVIVQTRRHRCDDISMHTPVYLTTGEVMSDWYEYDSDDRWEDEFELRRIT